MNQLWMDILPVLLLVLLVGGAEAGSADIGNQS